MYYWDKFDLQCYAKKTEFVTCSTNAECLSPMFCSFSNQCECSTYKYFESSTSSCVDKKLDGQGCQQAHHCRTDLGLQCILSTCSCVAPQILLAINQTCITPRTYGEPCTQDAECDPTQNMFCRTSLTDPCNCPQTSTVNMCDCKKTISDEQFWDGASCVAARDYNNACPGNYACLSLAKNLECVLGLCNCPQPGGMLPSGNCLKCLTNFQFFTDHCYHVSSVAGMDYPSAQTYCINLNNTIIVKLVEIYDAATFNFVQSLTDSSSNYWVNANEVSTIKWVTSGTAIDPTLCCIGGCDGDASNNCLFLQSASNCFEDTHCTTSNTYKAICYHN